MLLRLKRALTLGSTYFVKLFLEGGEVAIVEAKVLRLLDADETNGECKAALKFTSISLEDARFPARFSLALTPFLELVLELATGARQDCEMRIYHHATRR